MPTRTSREARSSRSKSMNNNRRSKPTSPTGTSTRRNAAVDAIALLKQDHLKVMGLLNKLEKTGENATGRREQLLGQMETEIKIHTHIEEQIFYPAFREAARRSDEHLYFEAVEEHHVVDMVLPEIKKTNAGTEEFAAKVKVLKDLIQHHAEEEEEQVMFPKARRILGAAQLRELGDEMRQRKEQLEGTALTRMTSAAGRTVGRVLNRNRRAA
jgi:hypothetical protein